MRLGHCFAALTLAVAVAACVRMDAPKEFPCESASDCKSGERCSSGVCLAAGECVSIQDCATMQACSYGHCVAAECWTGHEDACGDYACREGLCFSGLCNSNGDCRSPATCTLSGSCERPPKYQGQACGPGDRCVTGYLCCGPEGSKLCGFCFRDGSPCNDVSDCAGGMCCDSYYGTTRLGKECQSVSCAAAYH